MTYEVRANESGRGQLIATYKTAKAAKKRAMKEAYNYYYGTIVVDTANGLVDYGEKEVPVWEKPLSQDDDGREW